jgi:hypothetical protein
MRRVKAIVALAAILISPAAAADEKEPLYAIELSGARDWSLNGGDASAGPVLAVERTVIEHWLEVELALSPQFAKGRNELETEFIFKKPFELSEHLEFLIGAGPVWVNRGSENSAAAAVITQFEYFPNTDHKVGYVFEASYSYGFGAEHEQAFGLTAGIRFGID